MFGLVGNFKKKSVVELGCGNGYLAPKFLSDGVSTLIMMNISEHNLRYAAGKCTDSRVSFLEQDATNPWKLRDEAHDVAYSNMMLNEVEDIKPPSLKHIVFCVREAYSYFSVTHPA